jgi:glycosyltransferase involved in cell wall biosynthesis
MIQTLKKFESELNICGYIVPCPDALKFLEGTSKDTYAIPLGSKIYGGNIENIENVEIGEDKVGEVTSKEDARERLGLQEPKWIRIGGLWFNCNKIGFVFGFQSSNKGYNRLIEAANNTGIHLVISGSTHFTGYCNYLENLGDNITFLNRHLDEEEIDLWSLASDILLFDYAPQSHYSSSAALHRTAGAGRPIICVDTNHFSEIEDEKECLKYTCLEELERHIRRVLESESEYQMLSRGAIEFAKRTSRRLTAMKHIELYRQYGGL